MGANKKTSSPEQQALSDVRNNAYYSYHRLKNTDHAITEHLDGTRLDPDTVVTVRGKLRFKGTIDCSVPKIDIFEYCTNRLFNVTQVKDSVTYINVPFVTCCCYFCK